ncbi:MAG: type VI secretion system contractile sheath small subunit [Byssovorax sp.]
MATPNQLPAKSPILDKYKSRLHITYRTNISGTPVPLKLPFRVLVMGEFRGTAQREAERDALRDRKIRSIQMGAADSGVPAFMKEMTPWMRVPKALRADLEEKVPGTITITSLSFPAPAAEDFDSKTKQASVQVTGKATFTSTSKDHNGVCDIKDFSIDVTGTMNVVSGTNLTFTKVKTDLKLNGTVQGDILDPTTSKPTGVLTAQFATDDAAGVTFTIADQSVLTPIPNDGATAYAVSFDKSKVSFVSDKNSFLANAVRTIPFQSLNAFSPDEVVRSIPELNRLRVLRDLLHQLQSTVKNNRDLQTKLRAIWTDKPDTLPNFQKWAKQNFNQLLVKKEEK